MRPFHPSNTRISRARLGVFPKEQEPERSVAEGALGLALGLVPAFGTLLVLLLFTARSFRASPESVGAAYVPRHRNRDSVIARKRAKRGCLRR